MLKSGKSKKLCRGNLARVSYPRNSALPDLLAIWAEPPTAKSPHIICHIHKNDTILILDIQNVDNHIQYSKIFSANHNAIGWVNSRFLNRIQK